MQEVEAICDRAIIIDRGVIKLDDLMSNLLGKSASQNMEQLFHQLTANN
jgi:ABC-type Na+ transport system ATPase subunit NatA